MNRQATDTATEILNLYQDLTWDDDTSIRRYDDTAIIIGAQHQEATYQGNEIPGQFRCTQIAVRDGGDWVLAGVHLSPILQPPKT